MPQEYGEGCKGVLAFFRHLPELDAGGKTRKGAKGSHPFSQASGLVSGEVEGVRVCLRVCERESGFDEIC